MGRILSVGEILWDIFGNEKKIGGAPFNVAANARALFNETYILTAVGNDVLGREALEEIKKKGVNPKFVQIDKEHPTGTATVSFESPGIPTYDIPSNAAYNFFDIDNEIIKSLNAIAFDFICLGSMLQKSVNGRKAAERILNEVKSKYVFFDINIRQGFCPKDIIVNSLNKADIVKINDEEAEILLRILYNKNTEALDSFSKLLIKDFNLDCLIITLGAKGCIIATADKIKSLDSIKINVADTVGAGDAFSAGFISKFIEEGDFFKAGAFANAMGAYVASKTGAIPELNFEELSRLLKNKP